MSRGFVAEGRSWAARRFGEDSRIPEEDDARTHRRVRAGKSMDGLVVSVEFAERRPTQAFLWLMERLLLDQPESDPHTVEEDHTAEG